MVKNVQVHNFKFLNLVNSLLVFDEMRANVERQEQGMRGTECREEGEWIRRGSGC